MGYFSKGFTRDKLCALYFLDKFREDISLHTLCRLMHDNEWAPYLELHACMIGLERAGMVAAVPREFGQSYRITQSGLETIDVFKEQLPMSLRRAINRYIEENRDNLRKAAQYITDRKRLEDGSYHVTLTVIEEDSLVFKTVVHLANFDASLIAADNWDKTAYTLYSFAINQLLMEKTADVKQASGFQIPMDAKLSSSSRRGLKGSYIVTLRAQGSGQFLFCTEMRVPDEASAIKAASLWAEAAQRIYSHAMHTILC